jgi:hypothetical protein
MRNVSSFAAALFAGGHTNMWMMENFDTGVSGDSLCDIIPHTCSHWLLDSFAVNYHRTCAEAISAA